MGVSAMAGERDLLLSQARHLTPQQGILGFFDFFVGTIGQMAFLYSFVQLC